MPSNAKEYNQYYGKYLECCVVAILNNEEIKYKEKYTFTDNETIEFMKEANVIANYLGKDYTAIYEGDKTSSASGDILLSNGQHIEIKRVSAGTGTYFNTSVYYLAKKFNFDFKEYMKRYHLIDTLEECFGKKFQVKKTNNSPISQKDSSAIRHTEPYATLWKEKILPIDKIVREHFVQDLAEYFKNNTNQLYILLNDLLTKNTECNKTKPDRLIVYNYNKDYMFEINLQKIINNISTDSIRATEKGLIINNIRLQLGWQNGSGLNNPTIRVFLDKEEQI